MLPVISTGAHAGFTVSSRFALLFSLLFLRISLTCIFDSTLSITYPPLTATRTQQPRLEIPSEREKAHH